MIRKTVLAIATAAALVGAAAASVPASVAPKASAGKGHYGHAAQFKPVYIKGAIGKGCQINPGACELAAR